MDAVAPTGYPGPARPGCGVDRALPVARRMLGEIGQASAAHQRFTQYVTPEIPRLNRLAMQLVVGCDADDLVQETLLRAYRAIDRFDGRHPRAWVCTIMRNTWKNMLRDRAHMTIVCEDSVLERQMPICSDREQMPIHDMLEPGLADALAALPAPQYAAVSLVDLDGFSYQQAAELLSIPAGTVTSRVHRGREQLRDQLIAITMANTAHPAKRSNPPPVPTRARDLTEAAQAGSLYRTLIRHEPVIVFSIDTDGTILSRDGMGLAILGQSPGAGVGQRFADFHRASPAVIAHAERALAGQCTRARLELRGTCWEAYQSLVRNPNGQLACVVGAVVLRRRPRA
jgi:RNA polymerase sigma-70 factor (ECF subfamily)